MMALHDRLRDLGVPTVLVALAALGLAVRLDDVGDRVVVVFTRTAG